jgi:hypothetical protein
VPRRRGQRPSRATWRSSPLRMRGAKTWRSRSAQPPRLTMPTPCLCCTPSPVWARCSASCCSLKAIVSTASPADKRSPHPPAWSHAAQHRVAHGWAPQGKKAATRTASGPCPQRPRSACVTTRRARTFWPAWSKTMIQAKPCACWRINWAGRSPVCARVRGLSLWRWSSRPQGAERRSPAPHGTQKGGAGRARPQRLPRRRLCTPRHAEAVYPCALALAWPPALAPEKMAMVASGGVCGPSPEPGPHWRGT